MALELRSPLESCVSIQDVVGAAKTKGNIELIGGVIGFYPVDVENGKLGTFIIQADEIEVDVDSAATYNAGDLLYEDAAVPTGVWNKTGGAGRIAVAVCKKDYPALSTKVLAVKFSGTGV
jgi:hypothetical protein